MIVYNSTPMPCNKIIFMIIMIIYKNKSDFGRICIPAFNMTTL